MSVGSGWLGGWHSLNLRFTAEIQRDQQNQIMATHIHTHGKLPKNQN